MKRTGLAHRFAAVWLCAAALVCLCVSPAFAARDAEVAYEGGADRMIRLSDEDLFLAFKKMMPGDQTEQKVQIKNRDKQVMQMFLHAESMDASAFDTPEQQAMSDDLLTKMILTLTIRTPESGERVIYSGPASGIPDESGDGTGDMTQPIDLGTYQPGGRSEIRAILQVPIELGNEYQDAVARVRWIFTCNVTEDEPNGDLPVVDIPDYETPLSPPPGIDIPDYDTPLSPLPFTGDSAWLSILPVITGIAAAGVVLSLFLKRKRHHVSRDWK